MTQLTDLPQPLEALWLVASSPALLLRPSGSFGTHSSPKREPVFSVLTADCWIGEYGI